MLPRWLTRRLKRCGSKKPKRAQLKSALERVTAEVETFREENDEFDDVVRGIEAASIRCEPVKAKA